MNVTPFLGSGVASQLSENSGNDATTFIATNPLNTLKDANSMACKPGFQLAQLLKASPQDSAASDNNDLLEIQSQADDSDLSAQPALIIADKQQELLTHLLNVAELSPIGSSVQETQMTFLSDVEGNDGISVVSHPAIAIKTLEDQFQATITNGFIRHIDKLTSVQAPAFTHSPMLSNALENTEKTRSVLNPLLSGAIRNLADSGESIHSGLPQHMIQSTNNQTIHQNEHVNWSPIKLRGTQQQISQQLHTVLSERLQIQADNRVQQATIRLDPPDLGKIDISLHIDAGKLSVQIHASQSDVYRSLQQISNELRQHLIEQNFVQVNVQVSSDNSRQGQGQNSESSEQENILLAQEIEHSANTSQHDDSILTTV